MEIFRKEWESSEGKEVRTTEAEFDQLTNIQFKGPFFLTQKGLNVMNDGGGIVNISTGLARFSFPGYAA